MAKHSTKAALETNQKTSYTVMFVAGEASGDLLAAGLMHELKKRVPQVRFVGVGGEAMAREGLKSLFPMRELSLMGFTEVLPHIPHLMKRGNDLCDLAVREKIDVFISIDSPDFTLRVAKKVKAATGVPCLHYVSPSVWAWRRKRIFRMAKYLDHVLALFPFEPAIYMPSGLKCTFVGHPVAARMAAVPLSKREKKHPHLIIMPGSRQTELRRIFPSYVQTVEALRREIAFTPVYAFATAEDYVYVRSLLPHFDEQADVVVGKGRFLAMQTADAALVKSGTANLELAMSGVPMVVTYQTGALTYFLAKKIVRVPYVSPVNWVAGEKVVPEFLQEEATPKNVAQALLPLLKHEQAYTAQKAALQIVRDDLTTENPDARAAAVVAAYLKDAPPLL